MRRIAWTGRSTARLVGLILACGLCVYVGFCIHGCGPTEPPKPPEPTTNADPISLPPFIASTSQSAGAYVLIDVRHREHGCDSSGNPTSVTGAYDPDGDSMEYRFECAWSVFDDAGEKINDEWVTFPEETHPNGKTEQAAIVKLWIGWTEDSPLMPVAPQDCGPDPSPVQFVYSVRDGKGGEASCSAVIGK